LRLRLEQGPTALYGYKVHVSKKSSFHLLWTDSTKRRKKMQKAGILVMILLLLTAFSGCKQEEGLPEMSTEAAAKITQENRHEQADTAKAAAMTGEQSLDDQDLKQPKIHFDQPEFDFGEVEAGDKVEHVYTFKNLGEAELEIIKVGSS